ncbi:MAG: metallophosphoesterase family protein [Desulfomonilia bacterium]|jgi:serine/threonine protein phosphatase 1|uniref:Bis(5'-nucleosyl)-tetraphosphatase PrpE (Asymmetrical) n=1 Tax=anaerobic digester metagenome TaxID=1263854 RepID=A0A485M2T3_9ZZZZ|nr:metallophosphoesterase family protein [Pseudomonadota bacterium]HPD21845.1 metallophosphoesterase family protein [Deltaproteobacteria bacterium]HRS55941.1 metallophosphoesterase family protein [Desulfomonilia bacterium]HRV35633.1 metallophosphoesterase family protein [Desulfomonilia bacterium]
MMRTFAIGDIHGRLDLLEDLVGRIEPGKEDILVFLGDYIDRGPRIVETIDYLIDLAKEVPCIFLRGNHEDMFLEFLEFGTNKSLYFANGGMKTVESYLGGEPFVSHTQVAHALSQKHRDFYANLRWYYEDRYYIYVHAGIRPGVPMFRQERHDLAWIRDDFIFSPTGLSKKVVFGHTPFARPFVKEDKIGVDTGAIYGGVLTAVQLPEEIFIQSHR